MPSGSPIAKKKKVVRKKRCSTKKSPKRSPRNKCVSPRDKKLHIAFHSKKLKCPLCTKQCKSPQVVTVTGSYVNKGNRWFVVGKGSCGHKIHQFTKVPVSTKCSGDKC